MRVDSESIRDFMKKWNLDWENDSCENFTREQQMQMEWENPLCFNFKPCLKLNEKILQTTHGCAACSALHFEPVGDDVEWRIVFNVVIIDPVQAFLGADVDMNRANEVRPIFRSLGDIAQATGCAIVLIGHLNKAAGTQSTYRGLGSIDITAAVRSLLFIGKLKDSPTTRVLIHEKTAKSILISCGARLAPFDIAELRDLMAYDEMELEQLGEERTAMFVIISDTDDTFNFVVSIMYTQLFNLLCDRADDEHGGHLPCHVRLQSGYYRSADSRCCHRRRPWCLGCREPDGRLRER